MEKNIYHASLGLFSDEGISKDPGQSAHPEGDVIFVLSQGPNTFLENTEGRKLIHQLQMQATEYMGCVYVYTIYSQLRFFFYAGMTVGISNVISIVADEIKT